MAIDEREIERVRLACTRFLTHHYPRSARELLAELVDETGAEEQPDVYGAGEIISTFEAQVAALLGKEAAVFMPSGTLAQQAALRVWTDRQRNPAVALHARGHLDRQELFAYERLHGLQGVRVGSTDAPLTVDDLRGLRERVGALLLELPQRELGGVLPSWEELQAQVGWARERGVVTHLDGARLWESQPFYGRTLAEIAALFDSVYVSFYKTLGGLAGAALAGPADIVAEARVWQKRHGGTLIRLLPYVVSARAALRERLPRIEAYCAHARALAAALAEVPGLEVVPDPPQTNMFHLYLAGDGERLQRAALALAEESGLWLFGRLQPTTRPRWQKVELTAGDASLDVAPGVAAEAFRELLARSG